RAAVVMVIDDEALVRSVAQQALERHGYSVLLAEDGREGVRVLREHAGRVDLVILDLAMPVMGGPETLYALRRIDPSVRVIVSSGYDEIDTARRFSGSRLSGFLQKPFSAAKLASAVAAVLEQPEPAA